MSDSRHRSGDRTGPDRDLASGLAAVSSGLPGTLFRYLLRPDGSDAIWYVSAGCTELFELTLIVPASIARATRIAREPSPVQMEPDRP